MKRAVCWAQFSPRKGWGVGCFLAALAIWASPARAQGQAIYDFAANAGGATWNSSGGFVAYNVAFDPSRGRAAAGTDTLEDGVSSPHVYTQPPTNGAAPLFLEGVFSGIAIPLTAPMARFESQVGFRQGAAASTGIDFSVWILRGTEYCQLATLRAEYDTVLTPLCVDLTAYKGQTITLKLRVEAGADSGDDWGAWKAPQIVSEGETLFDFISNASQAGPWVNGAGNTVAFGTLDATAGGALQAAYMGEDGMDYAADALLRTQPDSDPAATAHYMRGKFASVSLASSATRIKFIARVGFVNGASSPDGVTFELQRDVAGTPVSLGTVLAKSDGRFDYLVVDLTAYKGGTETFYLKASAGATSTGDDALWTEARIVGYEPTEIYNFIDHVGLSAWSTGAGSISFPSSPSSSGYAQVTTGILEDGAPHSNTLLTHPDYGGAPSHFIQGQFDNVIIPSNATNVRFTAAVGLQQGASGGDGATFQVSVKRRGKSDVFGKTVKTYTGSLTNLSVNLSGFQGQNVSIILSIEPGASATDDAACWVAPRITAELPMQVYAADAGAVVSDGADDRTALNRAVNLASACLHGEIHFQAGTYNLSTTLNLSSRSNMNLRGSAAPGQSTLFVMGAPSASAINITASSNVATRNLAIDYDPLPFTQGTMSDVNVAAKTFTLTIDSGHRELDDGTGFFVPGNPPCWGDLHDPSPPYNQPENTCDWLALTSWTKTAPNTYNCAASRLDGAVDGMKFQYHVRANNILISSNCLTDGQIAWDYVTVYAGPCLVFTGVVCEKVFVRNCTVDIKPGTNRIKSTNGDGVHMQACVMGADVLDSVFHGLSDDGATNYAIGYLIVAADNNNTTLAVYTANRPLAVGDHLTLFRPSDGTLGKTVQVTGDDGLVWVSNGSANVRCRQIHVDQSPIAPLDPGWDNDRFFSEEYKSANWLINNCTFSNYRGCGIVGATSGGMATQNVFSHLSGNAISFANFPTFNGGLGTLHTLVENNTIDHCGYNMWFNQADYAGAIQLIGYRFDLTPSASILHDDVIIRNNTLTDWPRHAVYVASAQNVVIENNILTNTTAGAKASAGLRGAMMFDNVSNATVRDNTVVDNRPFGQVTGKIFHMNTTGLSASGNAYTANLLPSIPETVAVTSYFGGVPAADFTASPTWGSVPLLVNFTDTSTGGPAFWAWDFDNDGTWEPTAAQNPAYTYTYGGSFGINLAAANPYGVSTRTRTDYISPGRQVWSASANFATTQGANGWYYRDWNGSNYADMSWDTANNWWHGRSTWSVIGATWQHPDSTESARVWKAPGNLSIRITGNARKSDTTAGDGVIATIFKKSGAAQSTLWGPQTIAYNNSVGYNFDVTTAVLANDEIIFRLNRNGTSNNDSTEWDPTIQTLPGPPPAASFTVAPDSGQAPLTVNFTDTSTGNPVTWAWDFQNDGIVDSVLQNPQFRYTAPGDYTVKLTVGNDNGPGVLIQNSCVRIVGVRDTAARGWIGYK